MNTSACTNVIHKLTLCLYHQFPFSSALLNVISVTLLHAKQRYTVRMNAIRPGYRASKITFHWVMHHVAPFPCRASCALSLSMFPLWGVISWIDCLTLMSTFDQPSDFNIIQVASSREHINGVALRTLDKKNIIRCVKGITANTIRSDELDFSLHVFRKMVDSSASAVLY